MHTHAHVVRVSTTENKHTHTFTHIVKEVSQRVNIDTQTRT